MDLENIRLYAELVYRCVEANAPGKFPTIGRHALETSHEDASTYIDENF
jgi:hypothetical protein